MLISALFALSTSILISFFFGSTTMHIFIEFLLLYKRSCLIHTSSSVCRTGAVCAFWAFGIPEHTLQTRNFHIPETGIKIYTTKLRGWQRLGVIFGV